MLKKLKKNIKTNYLLKYFTYLKRTVFLFFQIKSVRKLQRKSILELKKKNKITVVFMVLNVSVWKHDYLYSLFKKNDKFEPIIILCPFVTFGEKYMLKELEMCQRYFDQKGYEYLLTIRENGEWMDVKNEIKPDIIFFTNHYKQLSRKEYSILEFIDSLTCYVPYFFRMNHLYDSNYNTTFHHLLWRHFVESDIHYKEAVKHTTFKPDNMVVTGYPGLDQLVLNKDTKANNRSPWKLKSDNKKKVIIAPHHTIDGQGAPLNYATFKQYADLFIDIAGKYQDKVEFAFKPHPLLKPKLYKDSDWGETKTDEYFRFWADSSNTILAESDYIDLFLTSDAMIHDCNSFMVEYLLTGKPVLFLVKDKLVSERMNAFGQKAFNFHYHAISDIDIYDFIENKVLANIDPMKDSRSLFCDEHILQKKGKLASEEIYDEIMAQVEQ